jgi:uncharacterized protein YbaP (TraB family)
MIIFALAADPGRASQSAPPKAETVEPDTVVVRLPGTAAPASAPSDSRLPVSSSAAGSSVAARRQGLLWKVTSGANAVYVLGSIHMASEDLYPLPPHVETAFQKSSVLVVEFDINKLGPVQMQKLLTAYAFYPPGDSLWQHLHPEAEAVVRRLCESASNCEEMARLKPWAISLMVSATAVQANGLRPELGIDKHFLDEAAGRMRVEQMESAEAQTRMLAQIPDAEQEQFLLQSMRDVDRQRQYGQELQDAWLAGSANRMESLLAKAFQDSADLERRMLGNRNPHMADEIERCLKSGQPAFAVMGAFHLFGKEGILRLLEGRGYRVKQVLAAQ